MIQSSLKVRKMKHTKITIPLSGISYFSIGGFIAFLGIAICALHIACMEEEYEFSAAIAIGLLISGYVIYQRKLLREAKTWKYEIVPSKKLIRKVHNNDESKNVEYTYRCIAGVGADIDGVIIYCWNSWEEKTSQRIYFLCRNSSKVSERLRKKFKNLGQLDPNKIDYV